MGDSKDLCPFDGTEIWGVNNGYRQVKKLGGYLNKLFIFHKQVIDAYGDKIFDWDEINSLGIEVINTHRVKHLKSKLYPYKTIVRYFKTEYFSNAICYMIAYALYKGYTHIRMYGIDMFYGSEYGEEKGGVEYWIGRAEGMGVHVDIGNGSYLCKTIDLKPYGFDYKWKDLDPDGLYKVTHTKGGKKLKLRGVLNE
jgi:hypothetical protein